MPKVLIADKMSPLAEEVFKKNNVEVDVITGLDEDGLAKIIDQYDGLAIRSSTTVTPKILEKATKLKVIGRAGIGVDNVDINAATAAGVIVMNTPFGNTITTAEHAIAMMFSLAREIPKANASTQAGKWEKSKFMGTEITGKTLGLIGCGNIGSIVANRALALQMKVKAYDPFLSSERAEDLGIEKVELDELFKKADFVTLHVPLNDATRNIIDKAAIAKMKKGVFIINCARGGLVVEKDLKEALESGQVAGAALDVFETEPAKENALFGMDNLVATPHLGAATVEAQENVAVQVAEQISDFVNNGTIRNSINIPAVSEEDAKKLKPYLKLAKQLGSFAGQVTESPIQEIRIAYHGDVVSLNTKPISAVLVQNILSAISSGVNLVNSMVIAKERGIKVTDTKLNEKTSYSTVVKLTLITDNQERSITGTLFNGKPRVVEVNSIKLEASLGARVLFLKNDDKPGFIGAIGKILGDNDINIASFHLGRNEDSDGEALALLDIDGDISKELMAEIQKMAYVKQAKFLKF
jgi:D-3-phosphoglycerate dehydrogenase